MDLEVNPSFLTLEKSKDWLADEGLSVQVSEEEGIVTMMEDLNVLKYLCLLNLLSLVSSEI